MSRRLLTVLGAVALALVLAGCMNFTVEKVVEPDGASTGPFTVLFDCGGPDGGSTDELTFNGEGTLLTNLPPGAAGICTVTETDSAGAESTTIECVDPTSPPVVTCTPNPDGSLLITGNGGEDEVQLRITNTFGEPTTTTSTTTAPTTTTTIDVSPVVIVADPNFTG